MPVERSRIIVGAKNVSELLVFCVESIRYHFSVSLSLGMHSISARRPSKPDSRPDGAICTMKGFKMDLVVWVTFFTKYHVGELFWAS